MTDAETIARIARNASEDGRISLHDADILFGRISQLEARLAEREEDKSILLDALKIHKEAIATLEARDANMLGVRNDLHARVKVLEDAIKNHRDQKADDRCWMDDDELYGVLCDGQASDRRVGDKESMLRNCARFIERRCEGGHWLSYKELQEGAEVLDAKVKELETMLRRICISNDRRQTNHSIREAQKLLGLPERCTTCGG